jgi:L,D-transpeptidase ErfK/SrfK
MKEGKMVAIFYAMMIFFISMISTTHAYAKNSHSTLCNDPQYTCYKVKRGDSWQKLFPDPYQRDLVMRINRINISLHPGLVIAIPNSPYMHHLDFSPIPTQIDPPGKKVIIVSMSKLVFGAYNPNGALEYWGPISGGKGYCPDVGRRCNTIIGKFTIYQKQGAGCVSTKFPVGRGGAPMPYCMFFHRGFALHGSYDVPGYHASHGCVRLFINDAKWLNQEFVGNESVDVVVNR